MKKPLFTFKNSADHKIDGLTTSGNSPIVEAENSPGGVYKNISQDILGEKNRNGLVSKVIKYLGEKYMIPLAVGVSLLFIGWYWGLK